MTIMTRKRKTMMKRVVQLLSSQITNQRLVKTPEILKIKHLHFKNRRVTILIKLARRWAVEFHPRERNPLAHPLSSLKNKLNKRSPS